MLLSPVNTSATDDPNVLQTITACYFLSSCINMIVSDNRPERERRRRRESSMHDLHVTTLDVSVSARLSLIEQ